MEKPCGCGACVQRRAVPIPALDLRATIRSRKVSFKEMMAGKWLHSGAAPEADPEGDAIIAMWERRLKRARG